MYLSSDSCCFELQFNCNWSLNDSIPKRKLLLHWEANVDQTFLGNCPIQKPHSAKLLWGKKAVCWFTFLFLYGVIHNSSLNRCILCNTAHSVWDVLCFKQLSSHPDGLWYSVTSGTQLRTYKRVQHPPTSHPQTARAPPATNRWWQGGGGYSGMHPNAVAIPVLG